MDTAPFEASESLTGAQGGHDAGAGEYQAMRERYQQTEWQLRTLVEGIPQLVWRSCDMGQWTWASPQWLTYTGQTQEQSHGRGWLDAVHPDDHAAALAAWAEARPHGALDVEFRVRRAADGAYLWHRTRSAPARDADGRIVEWLGTTTDIQDMKALQEQQAALLLQVSAHASSLEAEVQERRRAEEKLLYTAFHDDLTGLHNRTFFMGQLRRALSGKDGPPGRRAAVLILDLDGFKAINDSLGHAAGDTLLKVVGKRLRHSIGEADTLARIGGDEFGLIAECADDAALAVFAARVLDQVRRPTWFGRRQIVSTGSLGMTWVAPAQHSPEEVLQQADLAMYEVKRERRNGFKAFAEPMRASAAEVLDLRNDLSDAVARSELELHYQPIWDAATNTLSGFEALVRWRNPRLGLLQPGDFIPLAEESGLIRGIGRWVLQEGCAQFGRWREQFPDHRLTLNVNVCSEELKDPDFVPHLEATLAATGVLPGQLELEITEGVFLEHATPVLRTLAAIRALGVRIALDDFGTGYSSLSYLDRYEVDTIKIDRSFVTGMLTGMRTRAILDAVLSLGRALSLRVVAEGVETEQQRDAVLALRCDAIQGFLTGRPAPATDLAPLLGLPAGAGPG